MRVKTGKAVSRYLGAFVFLLLLIKDFFPSAALAFTSANSCFKDAACRILLQEAFSSSVKAPLDTGAGNAQRMSVTDSSGATKAAVNSVGNTAMVVAPTPAYATFHYWDQATNGRAQNKAKERYCAAYPYDSVCNSTVVRRSFVEGYAWVGCSTPTFRSLPIPEGQENNITSQPTEYCGPGGQLAHYKSGGRFDDTVFKGSFSIVTKEISRTMWAVEGYAWVGCSTPTFRSLPIPEGQENNITSQPTEYCGPGGQLAHYKSGGRFDDTVFKGSFSIVNKNTPIAWKDWPQAKRDTAVGLLTDTDWQSLANSMPAGGVLDGADRLNAEKIVIPGQETDDPNTPADERLLRKEDGFFTWPGIADFDKDGFSDETDPDDDNDGTSDTSDPAPRNPSVPVAVNTEDAGDEVTPEVLQEVQNIVNSYGESIEERNLQCVPCANEIEAHLREQGIHGRRIKLDTPRQTNADNFIIDDSLPPESEAISINGHHEGIGIRINGEEIVFDNHHPDGVPYEQWKENLVFDTKIRFGASFRETGYLF